jgi:hypothetical protein
MAKKKLPTVAIATIIVMILIATGFFTSSRIIRIAYSASDSSCPNRVFAEFNVKFENVGNAHTNLCVLVRSEDVSFDNEESCYFMDKDAGRETTFSFSVNRSSIWKKSFENTSISYSWKYPKYFNIFSEESSKTCDYRYDGSALLLI